MNARDLSRWAVLASLIVGVAGCRPSVEAICEELDDECGDIPYEECRYEGEALERQAEDEGCSEIFDVYIDCISDAGCSYDALCDDNKRELELCVGGFD